MTAICFKLITTISLVQAITIQRYYMVIEYSSHTVHFISMTHLFCKWKSIPLNLPKLSYSTPHTYFPW